MTWRIDEDRWGREYIARIWGEDGRGRNVSSEVQEGFATKRDAMKWVDRNLRHVYKIVQTAEKNRLANARYDGPTEGEVHVEL